jgi:hypothetical protein
VKKLEGGGKDAENAAVDEIVGSKDSRMQPTRTAFTDLVGAQDKKNYQGKLDKAKADLAKNPRDYPQSAVLVFLRLTFSLSMNLIS